MRDKRSRAYGLRLGTIGLTAWVRRSTPWGQARDTGRSGRPPRSLSDRKGERLGHAHSRLSEEVQADRRQPVDRMPAWLGGGVDQQPELRHCYCHNFPRHYAGLLHDEKGLFSSAGAKVIGGLLGLYRSQMGKGEVSSRAMRTLAPRLVKAYRGGLAGRAGNLTGCADNSQDFS